MPNFGATWFNPLGKCRCGKPATGRLMNSYNADLGPRCKPCAEREIKKAQKPKKKE